MRDDRLALLGMLESIARIEEYTSAIDCFELFSRDPKTMDACLMHLINIGEMASRLSDEVLCDESEINWQKIRGLRNIIAHDYFGIDYLEIWSVVSIHVPTLKLALSELLS
jgi:uncharacterized protein with HEPN domain